MVIFFLDLYFALMKGFIWDSNFKIIQKVWGQCQDPRSGVFKFLFFLELVFFTINSFEILYYPFIYFDSAPESQNGIMISWLSSILINYFIWGPALYSKSHMIRYRRSPDIKE